MDVKFNIFISHDSKDEVVALELRTFLEGIFPNANTYVSGRDLQGGQTWIEDIKLRLQNSQIIISLITKESKNSNWIHFETGVGFTEDKSIPLVADGLKIDDLVAPMSLLQARPFTKSGIQDLISDIAVKMGMRKPNILHGIDKLLDESDNFFSLRNQENGSSSVSKPKLALFTDSNTSNISNEIDPDILAKWNREKERAQKLMIQRILSIKGTPDIPTEEELNEMVLSKMQTVAKTFDLATPAEAVFNLTFYQDKLPKKDSKNWEKLNSLKMIESTTKDLDRYEQQN